MLKEIVVLSGKGGTGKTSLTAAFATLAENAVLADCDVDAADLHLVLSPEILERRDFISGNEAIIRNDDCAACGLCQDYCRFGAIIVDPDTHSYYVDPAACEGCGVCVKFCPTQAIDFPERLCGEWFTSATRFGAMIHAHLGIAAENSGKLVSLVRGEARKMADSMDAELLLVDGPPGIGCPVIASITGADHLVIVTEPTLSGRHDLERVLLLAKHFRMPTHVCVNKWDINESMTESIEDMARGFGSTILGRIRYDSVVTKAQIAGRSIIEMGESHASDDIKEIWRQLQLTIA